MSILQPQVFDKPVDERGNYTPSFYRFLSDLANAVNGGATTVDLQDIIRRVAEALGSPDGTVENIPSSNTNFTGSGWISVTGSQASGNVNVSQRTGLTTNDLPEGDENLYYTDTRADARADAGIAAHVAYDDPHPQYLKIADASSTGDQRIDAYGDLRIAGDGSLRITP